MLQGKCPKCGKGKIFTYPLSFLSRFNAMNRECPVCKVTFEPEPGFYQGAMYVGYALTILVITVTSLAIYLFVPAATEWTYIIVNIVIMFLLIPVNYRYSRIIYLHLFGGLEK